MRLVFRGKPTQSRAELFEGYSRQFRRAADAVFAADEMPELADRLRANVSRFAAYKSAYVESEFARIANDPKYNDATRKAAMNAAEDRFARWTDAEYNTATARCRTAKQMAEFMEPDNVRLFPNLEWLATRSANPRAEHQAFVGLILPKEHTFWRTHTPGTEWNCKCDLAETDAPASNADNLPDIKPPRGLEGNPYHTGKVFTDEVGYIRNAGNSNTQRRKAEYATQNVAHKSIQSESKSHPILSKECVCDINGKSISVGFAHWGVSETGYAMMGKSEYWLKNEVLSSPHYYFKKSVCVKDVAVDLSHNTGHTLKLKRKFQRFYYLKTQLADGTDVYLNVVLHQDGKYYLYTISKNLPEW